MKLTHRPWSSMAMLYRWTWSTIMRPCPEPTSPWGSWSRSSGSTSPSRHPSTSKSNYLRRRTQESRCDHCSVSNIGKLFGLTLPHSRNHERRVRLALTETLRRPALVHFLLIGRNWKWMRIKHPTNFEKVKRWTVVSTPAGKVHLAPWNYCSENKEYVDSFKGISEAEKCK